ncbi:hypothetical protein [Sphingomonas sp. ID0503]|uniref:hypothetical protein n=1 Tax=Sphingomonas sp. ID0503 TaxID=3399691 RepID=UPI003AFA7A1D
MSTMIDAPVMGGTRPQSAERRFFARMTYMMAALVLIGFAPSFYLRGLVHYPRPNPTLNPMVILHGVMFTLWLLVFWAQTALVAAGRRDLHMRLGIGGMVLAVLLVPVMYFSMVGQVARANGPPFATPLGWTAVPFGTLLAYIPLAYLGWRLRKDGQAHKRLMLSAALLFMGPAVGRLPIMPPMLIGHAILQTLAVCTFIPLILWDRRTLGRVHWATKLGVGLAAFAAYFGAWFCVSPWWEAFAATLPGV